MTREQRITTLDLPNYAKATVGFGRMFNELERSFANNSSGSGYPPYNIAQVNDEEYIISLAVAGFSMDTLTITTDCNQLKIEGSIPADDNPVTYLHHGIAARDFRREFTLADHVIVDNATLELGMLNIHLKHVLPDALKPKQITITHSKTK